MIRLLEVVAGVALGAVCLSSSSCQPQAIEIAGLAELTSEIRSQRLLQRSRLSAGEGGAPRAIPSEQVQAALSPLREVLQQLAASQKDLSGRQAILTQEMQRWTQLLVESMQSKGSEDAAKLTKRLADLEQLIASQDKRHREVEALLGAALDHTADQLEDFLKRLGADLPDVTSPPPEQPGAPKTGDAAGATPPAPGAGPIKDAVEGKDPPPTKASGSGRTPKVGDGEQRASLEWLWSTLAVMSLISGILLLRGQRPQRPLVKPKAVAIPTEDPEGAATPGQPASSANASAKDPEAEELWATAALLGEAIGRLKQSQEQPGEGGPADAPASVEGLTGAAGNFSQGSPLESQEAEVDRSIEDLFVVGADLATEPTSSDRTEDRPDTAAPETPAPATPAPGREVAQPLETCRVQLRASQQAEVRVRHLLGQDPRVMVTPAPQIEHSMGQLEVSFALIPGVPDGERSLLEQQLRETGA